MGESNFIFEANLDNFDQVVLEKSFSIPILVDFWAGWCNPCKMLMPLLETVVNEYNGKFLIAKVDTDKEQKLAGKYQIQGLPTVKLFINGQVASEFSGVQPLPAIKAFLAPYLPRESDGQREQALELLSQNKVEEAIVLLKKSCQTDTENIQLHVDLLETLLLAQRYKEAQEHIKELPVNLVHDEEFKAIKAKLYLAAQLEQTPDISATNLNSFKAALEQILNEEFNIGLETLLKLLEANPKEKTVYRDALLHSFELLEDSAENQALASRFRSRMFTFLH